MIETFWFYGEPYRIPSCWTWIVVQGKAYERAEGARGMTRWVRR